MRLCASNQNYYQANNSRYNCKKNNDSNNNIAFAGRSPFYVPDKITKPFRNLSSFQQRLGLGIFALVFQPVIDYCNPWVDEKTRKFSVLKTVVKAVVGTATGLAIRATAMSIVKHKLKNPQKFISKIKDEDLQKEMKKVLGNKDTKDTFIANFGSVVGLMGVAVGDFTFDMPLARMAIENCADAFGMSEYEKKEAKSK